MKKYYVEEGTVEFSNNNLLILTSTAINIVHLLKAKLTGKSLKNLNNQSTDKEIRSILQIRNFKRN